MAATQYGTKLKVGATPALAVDVTNYWVQSFTANEADVREVMTFDANGAPLNRCVQQVIPLYTLTLTAMSAATPTTDFAKGTVVLIGSDSWMVESAPVETKAEPWTLTVQLKNFNLAAV